MGVPETQTNPPGNTVVETFDDLSMTYVVFSPESAKSG